MIRTKHVTNYEGTLDEAIARELTENNITGDNLIDIKYSTRTPAVIYRTKAQDKPYFVDEWYSSVLIIWDDGKEVLQ